MPSDDQPEQRGGWGASLRTLGAVGGLGIEFATFVVAGAMAGRWLDARFGTQTVMVLVGVALALVAFGVHVRYLLRVERARHDEGEEGES